MTNDKMITNTIIISTGFFCVLFAVIAGGVVLNKLGFELDPVYIFIALIPFIVLLVLSGKLKEIKGPGDISLTFQDEAEKPVSPEWTEQPLKIGPEAVIEKGGFHELRDRIDREHPTTLSFVVGRPHYYAEGAIREYLWELERLPEFRLILFTDEDGRFKGCMMVDDYKALFRGGNIDVVEMLESGEILRHPRVIRNVVRLESTNREALEEMERAKVNLLAVVDHHGRFVGVVTQEEIVRRILIKVLGAV